MIVTVLLALSGSLLCGLVHHVGTEIGRKSRLMTVVLWVHLFAVGSIIGLAVLVGGEPTMSDLLLGAASGLGGSMGVIQLYRGYTTKGAAIVGPVAVVTGAVIPVIASAIFEGPPSAVVRYGILVGVAAVWMISLPGQIDLREWRRSVIRRIRRRRGEDRAIPSNIWDWVAVRHGLAAGALFAMQITLLGMTSDDSGVWPVAPGRVVAAATVAFVILFGHPRPAWRWWTVRRAGMVLKVVLLGLHTTKWLKSIVLATALMGLAWSAGVGFFTLAAQRSLAVTGLFYQMAYGFTLLFQVLFAGERTSRIQVAGFGLAAASLTMIIFG